MTEHTGALIVALPAVTDQIHSVSKEDVPHVTMNWFGEAADLPEELVQAVRECVQAATTTMAPFTAKVSGLALLGDDKASVLLLESAELTALHELLCTAPPVAAAMAMAEQFPNWTPHLTLGYPDDLEHGKLNPDDLPDEVSIDSLGLWIADEKEEFPLVGNLHLEEEDTINDDTQQDGFLEPAKEKIHNLSVEAALMPVFEKMGALSASLTLNLTNTFKQIADSFDYASASVKVLTAALKKPHNPALHPRGPDGRFIKKYGVMKFLGKDNKWKYGRVDRIFEDDDGKTMVGLTPSDLGGKPLPGAQEIELSPKKLYSAPKKKAHLTTSAPGTKKVGGQAGSNQGGLYDIPKAKSKNGVQKVTPAEAAALKAKVTGDDDQSEYIRRALSAKMDFADEDANVYATIGDDGVPTGALALVKRPEEGANVIDYVGAKGVGRELVLEAAKDTKADGLALLAEPTAESIDYWKSLGFTEDPDGMGTPFYGVTGEALDAFIANDVGVTKFYVKKPKTKKHGQNEELANDLYAAVGTRVPDVTTGKDGMTYSEIVPGKHDAKERIAAGDKEWMRKVQNDFVVDAWLGNWDVMGMGWDNILTTEDGTPVRIDNGGAVLYRAMGAEKGTAFSANVGELTTMKTGKKAAIYGKDVMPLEAELDGAQRILALSPTDIENMVSKAGLPKSTADTLKARRKYIAEHYKLPLPESVQVAGTETKGLPLVDSADLSKSHGKDRNWQPMSFEQAKALLKDGDQIYFVNTGDQSGAFMEEVDDPSVGGGYYELKYDAPSSYKYNDGPVLVLQDNTWNKKPRPVTGSKVAGEDLPGLHWQRGDTVKDQYGVAYEVLGTDALKSTFATGETKWVGKMLVKSTVGSGTPFWLNADGKQYTVKTWDAPKTADVYAEIITPDTTKLPSKPAAPEAPKYKPEPAKPLKLSNPKTLTGAQLKKLSSEDLFKAYGEIYDQYVENGNALKSQYKPAIKTSTMKKMQLINDELKERGYNPIKSTTQALSKIGDEEKQTELSFPEPGQAKKLSEMPKLEPGDQIKSTIGDQWVTVTGYTPSGNVVQYEYPSGHKGSSFIEGGGQKYEVKKKGTEPAKKDAGVPWYAEEEAGNSSTALDPKDQSKIDSAEQLFGFGSEEYKAAVMKWGTPPGQEAPEPIAEEQPKPAEPTGMAVAASQAIKADIIPPASEATPEQKVTLETLPENHGILSDLTVAAPGDHVVSKKDGKTYIFVSGKDNYGVVTDPSSATPDKKVAKSLSVLTQPGVTPTAEPVVPKTKDGKVPTVGMGVVMANNEIGTIDKISKNGNILYIKTSDGKVKPKKAADVEAQTPKKVNPYVPPFPVDDGYNTDGKWMIEVNVDEYGDGPPSVYTKSSSGSGWVDIMDGFPMSDKEMTDILATTPHKEWKSPNYVEPAAKADTDESNSSKKLSAFGQLQPGTQISPDGGDHWYTVKGYSSDGKWLDFLDENGDEETAFTEDPQTWTVAGVIDPAGGDAKPLSQYPTLKPGDKVSDDGGTTWYAVGDYWSSGDWVNITNEETGKKYAAEIHGKQLWLVQPKPDEVKDPDTMHTTEPPFPIPDGYDHAGKNLMWVDHPAGAFLVEVHPDGTGSNMKGGTFDHEEVMYLKDEYPSQEWKSPVPAPDSSGTAATDLKVGHTFQLSGADGEHTYVVIAPPDKSTPPSILVMVDGDPDNIKVLKASTLPEDMEVTTSIVAPNMVTAGEVWTAHNNVPFGGPDKTVVGNETEDVPFAPGDVYSNATGTKWKLESQNENGLWEAEYIQPDGYSAGPAIISPDQLSKMTKVGGNASAPAAAPKAGDTYTDASGFVYKLTSKDEDGIWKTESTSPDGQDIGAGSLTPSMIKSMTKKEDGPAAPKAAPDNNFADYEAQPGDVVVKVGSTDPTNPGDTFWVKTPGTDYWKKVVDGKPTGVQATDNSIEYVLGLDDVESEVVFGQFGGKGSAPPPSVDSPTMLDIDDMSIDLGHKIFTDPYSGLDKDAGVDWKIHAAEKIKDLGVLQPGQKLWYVPAAESVYVTSNTGGLYELLPNGVLLKDNYTDASFMDTHFVPIEIGMPTEKSIFVPNPDDLQIGDKLTSPAGSVYTLLWQHDNGNWAVENSNGLELDFTQDQLSNMTKVGGSQPLTVKIPGTTTHPATPGGYELKPGQNVKHANDGYGDEGWYVEESPGTWKKIAPSGGVYSWSYAYSEFLSMGTVTDYKVPSATAVPSAPAVVPTAPTSPASVPLPTSEAIASWGKPLTKSGHIPSVGMKVVDAKGEVQTIVGTDKSPNYVKVKGPDGKTKARALKTLTTVPDGSASPAAAAPAYVAPVAAGPAPKGMPIAADPPDVAFEKTLKDGKWRPIMSGSGGIRGGEMFVSSVKTPSGKKVLRVNFTLTKEQREKFLEKLKNDTMLPTNPEPVATGPAVKLGGWEALSKQSQTVKVGDAIPMRVATSSYMPDGSAKWKVNTEQNHDAPTHKVTKVEDATNSDGKAIKIVTLKDIDSGEEIVSHFHPNKNLPYYLWDPQKVPAPPPPPPSSYGYGGAGTDGKIELGAGAKAAGWKIVTDGGVMGISGGHNGKLKTEPGVGSQNSAAINWTKGGKSLRKVGKNGVVIEMITPAKVSNDSASGATVITIPEGMDSAALNETLAELGIPYTPVTQQNAKLAVLPMLKQLVNNDVKKAHNNGGMPPSDIDSMHGWSEKKILKKAADTVGIPDLGWQDIMLATDESNGKVSYFWSARVQDAIEKKTSFKSILREISTVTPDTVKSQLMFGAANGVMQKRIGGLIGGGGDSAPSDTMNLAGNGSFSSAYGGDGLPSDNPLYGGSANMMAYVHPMSVLGRIQDYRVGPSSGDAFGSGGGKGSNSLQAALTQGQSQDVYLGGGIPAEDLQFLMIKDNTTRNNVIKTLKQQGYQHPSGKPLEQLIVSKNDLYSMSYKSLKRPPYFPPNAKAIIDLPVDYPADAEPEIASAAA